MKILVFCAAVLWFSGAIASPIPVDKNIGKVQTYAGTISIIKQEGGEPQQAKLNGKVLAEDQYVNVLGKFNLPTHEVVVLTTNCGGSSCGYYGYEFVAIFPDKKIVIAKPATDGVLTPDIGTIDISVQGDSLVIIGKGVDGRKTYTKKWIYSNGMVKASK